MGFPVSQPSIVVLDTGSNWLTTTSVFCGDCATKAYDPRQSQGYQVHSYELEHQVYGSAQLEGYVLSDVVCLEALTVPKTSVKTATKMDKLKGFVKK